MNLLDVFLANPLAIIGLFELPAVFSVTYEALFKTPKPKDFDKAEALQKKIKETQQQRKFQETLIITQKKQEIIQILPINKL